jgi:hypothetical protein
VSPYRRREAFKALALGLTIVIASTMPVWTLPVFLYVCGAVLAGVAIFLFGALLQLYVGFRLFERQVDATARRFLRRPRPFVRPVRR